MTDASHFAELFSAEAKELTATLESVALALEATPDDQERLNELFRAAHSLKGAAAMVGLSEVVTLTHALETMLDMWRCGALRPRREQFALLFLATDMLTQMIRLPTGHAAMPDPSKLAAMLELASRAQPPSAAVQIAESSDARWNVRFAPQATAYQWGGDPMLVMRELRSLCSEMSTRVSTEQLPPLAVLEPANAYLCWEMELTLSPGIEIDRVHEAFAFFEGLAELTIEPRTTGSQSPARHALAAPTATGAPHVPANQRPQLADTATIRVAAEKVDSVIDLMGELMIAQAVVRELVRNCAGNELLIQEAVLATDRHLRDLQERVMSIRMVPVGTAFSRVPRVVRDLAQRLGKEVRLELLGTETEMDKTLMDKLADPLLHLVRNALDHGIETVQEREAAGKDPVARLQVSAYARVGSVFVEVSDDGRGLDRERIRRKAVERGLLVESAAVSDEALWKFIFHPGFSTKDEVTDVSGRGVGLDVVSRSVEELGGDLSVCSQSGRGARFQLRLPLTLTILDGLLLCAGAETCVLPLVDIAFSARITPGQIQTCAGGGVLIDLFTEVVPYVELSRALGYRSQAATDSRLAVVVQSGGYRYALGVDALLGQTQSVVKSLETHYQRVPGIMGATILGNGRVALILDGLGIAARSGLQKHADIVHAAANAAPRSLVAAS